MSDKAINNTHTHTHMFQSLYVWAENSPNLEAVVTSYMPSDKDCCHLLITCRLRKLVQNWKLAFHGHVLETLRACALVMLQDQVTSLAEHYYHHHLLEIKIDLWQHTKPWRLFPTGALFVKKNKSGPHQRHLFIFLYNYSFNSVAWPPWH